VKQGPPGSTFQLKRPPPLREGYRRHWRRQSGGLGGRPRIPRSHINLIRRILADHPEWGESRIALELKVNGIFGQFRRRRPGGSGRSYRRGLDLRLEEVLCILQRRPASPGNRRHPGVRPELVEGDPPCHRGRTHQIRGSPVAWRASPRLSARRVAQGHPRIQQLVPKRVRLFLVTSSALASGPERARSVSRGHQGIPERSGRQVESIRMRIKTRWESQRMGFSRSTGGEGPCGRLPPWHGRAVG
jgi:hypothetical protein